jgi:hypothetical protein
MRSRSGAACAVALGVALATGAGPAAACPPPVPPDPQAPRSEVEVGPWFVFTDIDHFHGYYRGARLAVGHRWHGLLFQGEVDLGDAILKRLHGDDLPEPIRGFSARAGANLRWTFARAHAFGHAPIVYQFWLQGGVGAHLVQWWGGGRLARPDGQVGLGLSQVIGRSGRFSLDSAVVIFFSGGRAVGAPTCAGPCDEPTPPIRGGEVDVVDHFAFTVRW